jgi:hypothetical protein
LRNVRQWQGSRVFLINGGDPRNAVVAIAVILGVTAVGVGLAAIAAVLESWVGALVSLVAIFPALFLILRALGSGRFARYLVVFKRSTRTVVAKDIRTGQTLFDVPFDPDRLYLARTRVQIGYVSTLKLALVYGHPVQDVVEDAAPSERMSLLTIAPEAALRGLVAELVEGLSEPR